MNEVANVASAKATDTDAKANGTEKTGIGGGGGGGEHSGSGHSDKFLQQSVPRGREVLAGEENKKTSRQSSPRRDIGPREKETQSFSYRDGNRNNRETITSTRRSSSRGGGGGPLVKVGPGGSGGSSTRMKRTDERNLQSGSIRTAKRDDQQYPRNKPQGALTGAGGPNDKKGDLKDNNKGYCEDPLVKLMKRITRVNFDKERRLVSARQLKEYLLGLDAKATKSSKQIFDAMDSLQNVLYERCSKELKTEVSSCIGLLGSRLGQDIPGFFDWVFTNVNASDVDVKTHVCRSLLEMLKQDEVTQRARDCMMNVMISMQQLLESTSSSSLLMMVIDIILMIAKVYPHVFSSYFGEVADILIGWLIDPTQSMLLLEHISAALVQLQPFWISDIQFSVMLLGQFTEDLEILLGQDLNQALADKCQETVKTVSDKIAAILRVFYTVVLSLGDSIGTMRGGQITMEYLMQLLKKLLVNLTPALKSTKAENVVLLGNDSVRLLLHQLSAECATACGEDMLEYVICQSTDTTVRTDSVIVSLLRLLQKVVEVFGTQLPDVLLTKLLGPSSALPACRFSHCAQVLTELMAMYLSLLSLKSVPLLEEAYRLVLSDMEVAYNTLLVAGNKEAMHLVSGENPFKEFVFSRRQAQLAIMFDLGALTEIANTKSNLIGMWALSPSIFNLLSRHLRVTDCWMNTHHSQVVYTTLHAFFSHCNRHGNFISSSVLLSPPGPVDSTRLATMSQATSQNFSEILRILVTLLDSSCTAFDCRCLLMKWSSDIVAALAAIPHVYTLPALHDLINSVILQGYHREQQILQCSAQWLKTIFKATTNFDHSVVKKCAELCVYRISDTRKTVRESFLSLLKILPLDKIINMGLFQGEEEWMSSERRSKEVGLTSVWHVRRAHMAQAPSGHFHSHNFRHIMAFILNGTQPSQNGSFHWLEAMYHAKQRSNRPKDNSDCSVGLTDIIDNNESLLWFWATWECAQFAILSRLRTPLGKAPETFMAIEGVIKAFAAESQSFEATEDGSDRRDGGRGEKVGEYVCLQRVHLLMNFMKHLEKLLYNAYEGCAVAMPPVHKIVKTFFRTNRNTCQEWLSRIRMSLLTISVHCGMSALAVRQGFELLRDMDDAGTTQGPVFEQALVYIVQALCELGAPESVLGIYNWCRETTGRAMSWILAAAEKAHKRYEKAAVDYKSSLKIMLSDHNEEDEENEEGLSLSRISPRDSPRRKLSSRVKPMEYQQSTLTFVANQVTDSYMRLCDWDSVMEWQEWLLQQQQQLKLESGYSKGGSVLRSSVDSNLIKAMAEFESGNLEGIKTNLELVPGMSLTETNGLRPEAICVLSSWDMAHEEEQLRRMFLRASTQLMEQTEVLHRVDSVRCIQQAERLGDGLLRVCAMAWPPALPSDGLTQLASLVALRKQLDDKKNKTSLLPLSPRLDSGVDDVTVYNQLIRTVQLQSRLLGCDKEEGLEDQLSSLRLAVANVARKQLNTATAEEILLKQCRSALDLIQPEGSLLASLTKVRPLAVCGSPKQLEMIKLQREGAKLLRISGNKDGSLEVLSGSVVASSWPLDGAASWMLDAECAQLNARSLLTLVKWLQMEFSKMNEVQEEALMNNAVNCPNWVSSLNSLLELERVAVNGGQATLLQRGDSIGSSPLLSKSESILGRLLHLSSMQSPSLGKAWFSLAAWCYKWGRKTVDNASNGYVKLSAEEEAQVIQILPQDTTGGEEKEVLSILSHIHNQESSDEDIMDQDQSMYDDGTDTVRKRLLACSLSLMGPADPCVEKLISVWRGVVKRVYHYYQLSAKAYFTYLHVNGLNEGQNNEGGTITSTLRLLRLLVKYASELREVLETGLSQTPTAPWKGIIPQLFSRLSHPESYVRQSISELLCRIALDAPHLIVYPAVVGSTSKIQVKLPGQKGFLKSYLSQDDGAEDKDLEIPVGGEEDEEEEEELDEGSSPELQACLSSIVDALSKLNPQMIAEVQLMVQELRRVTLLWEELWLGTLNQQQTDVQRRLAQLSTEIKRVEGNKSLSKAMKETVIREKHRTIMKPTLYTMEHLHEITSQAAQTPQERRFQAAYGKQIAAALQRLRDPQDPANPHDTWALFKSIHHSLQQRAQKRNSLQLKMDEISPKLASLKSSVIPMPGLTSAGKVVTIEAVHNFAQILPTKTKPKKLIFIGSDGKKHPYLFKGLEDLHLDERIMQFLSIVNDMFACNKKNESRHQYRARRYSVTPLGPRSGLIQWVEGATALFSLYKKWQQREALAQSLKPLNHGGAGGNPALPAPVPTIPRPSEVFYSKLTPALKEKGIESLDNRKEWPMSVLRKVLDDLMDETPDDLLAKELWCCSSGAGEWWQMTQAYARSTAVMSMIGYIIGLGDRHLDNVLVDLATGEVVHIDYNVCFEKGKGLRVPEKVPFRMTANIETALGLTGIEGTFRVSSEHVMKIMRKGRESLLTLLEAFVYDPLVDWTTGGDAGYTGAFYGGEGPQGGVAGGGGDARQSKQQMERDITTSMFSIRLAEMDSAWGKNKSDLLSQLPVLSAGVKEWLRTSDQLGETMTHKESLQQEQQMLTEAQGDPHHNLLSLSDRYSDYMVLKATRDHVMEAVGEKINEYSNWHKVHSVCLEKLQGLSFKTLCGDVSSPLELGPPSFAASSAFLQSAGQSQIISQCEQLEAEMVSAIEQRRSLLQSVIKSLLLYSNIVSQFGVVYAEDNRTYKFLGWLQELLSNFTSQKCEEVLSQFQDSYSPAPVSQMSKAQTVMAMETKLQNVLTDTNSKLMKLIERRGQDNQETLALEMQVQEADEAIKLFVYENGVEGERSLMSVIVSALYTLNKRYLLMEGAAAGAGDRLMDLTSRDGDWFLDELCSMSGNVNQFLETLNRYSQIVDLVHVNSLQQSLRATHKVYIALQDLNMNFRSIILPEAVKLSQASDPHFLSIVTRLEKVINGSSLPLATMVSQLELLHRNAIMGIQDEKPTDLLSEVKWLQQEFATLLPSGGASAQQGGIVDQLTSGQMLLMGFNGLFTRLESDFAELLDGMESLDVPVVWKKVDTVREAKSMQLSTFNETTRPILNSLFFLKRLQAIQEFLYMATQFAAAIQGISGGAIFDEEQMAKPVKKFVADFVRKQLLGFPSQVLGYIICVFLGGLGVNVRAEIELKDIGAEWKVPLDALCKKGMETCLTTGQFQHRHLTAITALTSNLDTAWRKLDLAKRLDTHILLMKSQVHRWQPQLSRYQWLHEDVFTQSGRQTGQLVHPARASVMSEMKKTTQRVLSQETVLTSCQEHYSQMETSISQRLRWAAGANPSLNTVLSNFENAISYRKKFIEEEGKRVSEATQLCQSILHLEALRTHTQEASATDKLFMQLLNKCSECCMLLESTSSSVSDQELQILSIKDLENGEKSDVVWMKKAEEAVENAVTEAQRNIEQIAHSLSDCQRDIKEAVLAIKSHLTTHHKLMSDIRSILKTLAKLEEQDQGEEVLPGSIRAYLSDYKTFSERITATLKAVVGEAVTREDMSQSIADLEAVEQQLDGVYDSLTEFAPSILSKVAEEGESLSEGRRATPQTRERDSPSLVTSTAMTTSKPQGKKEKEKLVRDPKTGKALQERNSYAVSVWRRVKMKLEGRDPDPNKRMSVAEQVDMIIKEAKNPDNLAVLYEGWTPWV
ncbi:serine/threonine-protein kinase SMG1 [Aplysia californica]|uniref:non-specific serine/threonine protein kinase n=1 Tax=Aplysia californica TaxID=6500 RepID=A0ABM0JP34_APLCA|nr:serine/threonine-protein kinase SMG1 [Aplysia californica]